MLDKEKSGVVEDTEARLRAEIEELKRRLEQHERKAAAPPHPSRTSLWLLALLALALTAGAFFAGYLPRRRRESVLASEASAFERALPKVNVVPVIQSP